MHSAKTPTIATVKHLFSIIIATVCIASVGAADFPYQLQRSDVALSLAAATLFGGGMFVEQADNIPPSLSRGSFNVATINRFDRSAVRHWSPRADRLSDYAVGAILAAPAITGLPLLRNRAWGNLATLAVMYGEALLLTAGLNATVKELTHRDRPYLYNDAFSDAEYSRLAADPDSRRSFYSRHTALAFCSAAFLSKTAADIHGPSKLTVAVWGGSLAAATAVSVSRYNSGQHFPTDILAGAVIGGLVGYGIPRLHKKRQPRTVEVGFTGDRLVVGWRF